MEMAFAAGYDPALELATRKHEGVEEELDELTFNEEGMQQPATSSGHLRRREQDWIDRIVHGADTGHYYVLLGPKARRFLILDLSIPLIVLIQGSGKATMIFDAMQVNQAEGVAMCDAHPNLDVFRLRLGRALNFEYNEDSQTGLFQRRDPKEGMNLYPVDAFGTSSTDFSTGGAALDIERGDNARRDHLLVHANSI
jgi:hypothetical protein